MKKIILTALLLSGVVVIYAQEDPKPIKWRRNYIEIGASLPQGDLGKTPNSTVSVAANMLSGVYGAKTGFTFAKGSKYYFNSKSSPVRVGLDWTQISISANKLSWSDYKSKNGGSTSFENLYQYSMRLGPVVSWRPVSKLIIDLHAQVAPTLQLSAFSYADRNDSVTFSLINTRILHDFGWKGYFGLGVRYGIVGIGLDYYTGKINTQYSLGQTDAEGNEIVKEQKTKADFLQLKLTLNF